MSPHPGRVPASWLCPWAPSWGRLVLSPGPHASGCVAAVRVPVTVSHSDRGFTCFPGFSPAFTATPGFCFQLEKCPLRCEFLPLVTFTVSRRPLMFDPRGARRRPCFSAGRAHTVPRAESVFDLAADVTTVAWGTAWSVRSPLLLPRAEASAVWPTGRRLRAPCPLPCGHRAAGAPRCDRQLSREAPHFPSLLWGVRRARGHTGSFPATFAKMTARRPLRSSLVVK